MRIRGLGKLRRAARRLSNRRRPGALVLLYHRVTRPDTDPQWLAVAPDSFDQQLDMLRRAWRVLSLAECRAALRDDALPHRSVVITFDDGYADNLHQAKPLLEKHGLPATIFVSSGFVGRREEFFWDELDRLLLQPGQLPPDLNAAPPCDEDEDHALASPMTCQLGADEPWRWHLGSDATYAPAAAAPHRRWHVLEPTDPTRRHAAYRALCPAIAHADPATRRAWLARLRQWAGAPAEGRESHRTVTVDELNRLAACPLIEIGGHTVHHPRLAALPPDAQRHELKDGKRQLEQWINRPVETFSYPFGGHDDYTPDTVRLTGECGFAAACSNFGGVVRHRADPFQLNRVLVRDWPADELDRRIREWFLD